MPRDLDLSHRIAADQIAVTSAESDALGRLREVTGDEDGPMERHGLRCFAVCDRIAAERSIDVDRELLFVAGLLHDIGLYDGASRGGVYVSDGSEFAAELLGGRDDWDAKRIRRCLDAIERHHELRPQWSAGPEVELMRRADLVELSRGLLSFGAGRDWLRQLWDAVPRDGLYGEVGAQVLKAARERPTTLPRIFVRGS